MASPTTDRRQGLSGAVAFKAPVACATTANITLSGEQTLDGVLTSASRVLGFDEVLRTPHFSERGFLAPARVGTHEVLAPGLRLGYLVAPREVYPKLLQAKQAADLQDRKSVV